jgi:phosphate transport system substrate-binding protein
MKKRADTFFPFFLSVVLLCLTLLFLCPGRCNAETHLVVPGTGDSQSLLRILATQFVKQYPEFKVDVPDSIGSSGGIRGLLQKHFELARTARPLKADEQDGSLVEYPFAASLVVFATHPSVDNVDNLSSNEILGIYTGEITQWPQAGGPDGRIYPLDRESGDSSRSIVERHMHGFKDAESIAKIIYTTPDMVDALKEHRHTIGFIPMGLAREAHLNVLSLDGVAPNSANVGNGSYPYITIYSIVACKPVSENSKRFIDFLHSVEAAATIRERGLIPLEKRP